MMLMAGNKTIQGHPFPLLLSFPPFLFLPLSMLKEERTAVHTGVLKKTARRVLLKSG